jgi:catechol 2,3-dioxygenase-like lactoylglutathione lyase family enzyme
MLERTDRLALAVPDADAAAATFRDLFDCEVVEDAPDAPAGARRLTLAFGRDLIELFEPRGPGPVADFLAAGRRGIFAGGFALRDPAKLAARLASQGIPVHAQDGDRFVVFPADLMGTGVILTPPAERPRIGLADKIWQITYAVADLEEAIAYYGERLGIGSLFTNRYSHRGFGYEGAIVWFDARDGGLLDSLEYLEPSDPDKAVARFVQRQGAGIYMASIEVDDVAALEARVRAAGPGWDGASGFGGFIHPRRLHGLLVGVTTYARWNAQRPLPSPDQAPAGPPPR